MRNSIRLSIAVALVASVPRAGLAQPILKKGEVVVVKMPREAFKQEEKTKGQWSFSLTASHNELSALVEPAGEGVAINGKQEWATMGFPSLLEATVEKITKDKYLKGQTEVQLKAGDWKAGSGLRVIPAPEGRR